MLQTVSFAHDALRRAPVCWVLLLFLPSLLLLHYGVIGREERIPISRAHAFIFLRATSR